ncbi:MAG: hypothetical protein U1E65_09595 [Myxococcota bacterium]
MGTDDRRLSALLGGLVAFDVGLTIWAGAFPGLWFWAFHGVPYADPQGFLYRCAANWAAFALVQAIALAKWRTAPVWLAVVAGVRLSDVFTDLVYVLVAPDRTWFALVALPPMGLVNLWLGRRLLAAYRARLSPRRE